MKKLTVFEIDQISKNDKAVENFLMTLSGNLKDDLVNCYNDRNYFNWNRSTILKVYQGIIKAYNLEKEDRIYRTIARLEL